jgi:hypothetical protein
MSRPTREALFLLFAILVGSLSGIGALAFLGLIALGQGAFWPAGDNFLIQVSLSGKSPREFRAEDLKTAEVMTVIPEDNLETALDILERDLPFLPVVPQAGKKTVLGVVRTDDVLIAYKHKLLKLRLRRKE